MAYPERWTCPNCRNIIILSKRCKFCGLKFGMYYPNVWDCPNCDKMVEKSQVCPICNYPKNLEYPKLWHCTQCGKLVKQHTKCPNCSYRKTAESGSLLKDINNFMRIAMPSYLLILVFIVMFFIFLSKMPEVGPSNTQSSIVSTSVRNQTYYFGSARIVLPLWGVVQDTSTSKFLRNSTLLTDLNVFSNEPYFSSLSDETYRLYTQINQQFPSNISSEYDRDTWHVLCFSSASFDSCIAVSRCIDSNLFVQILAFNTLNSNFYHSILDSYCCNC